MNDDLGDDLAAVADDRDAIFYTAESIAFKFLFLGDLLGNEENKKRFRRQRLSRLSNIHIIRSLHGSHFRFLRFQSFFCATTF